MNKLKKEKGITLVALIITIVILLILAIVAIRAVTGYGIIKHAQDAKENTRGGEVKEAVELVVIENEMLEHTNLSKTKKTKEDVILELKNKGLLTEKEITTLETEDKITIGNIEIDFSKLSGTEEEGEEIVKSNTASPLIIGEKDETTGEITVRKGKYELQVGDYINYSPTDGVEATTITSYSTGNGYSNQEFSSGYKGKWRVLGISEEGQIVIVPETVIKTTSDEYYHLKGQTGYANAVSELDKISEIFGNGYGAIGARSVRLEDINKITGYNPENIGVYDPEQTGSGTRYNSGSLSEYRNKVTYYWQGTAYPYYTYTKLDGKEGTPGSLSDQHSTFNWYDNSAKEWKTSTQSTTDVKEKITTLESNYYRYYLNSLTTTNESGNGLTSGSKAYTTIYYSSSDNYWLGSPYIGTYASAAYFGVRVVKENQVHSNALYYSHNIFNWNEYGVRPAVYLDSDIELTGNSIDGWTIVKK